MPKTTVQIPGTSSACQVTCLSKRAVQEPSMQILDLPVIRPSQGLDFSGRMKRGIVPAVVMAGVDPGLRSGTLALCAASETWGRAVAAGLEVRRENFCVPLTGAPVVAEGYAAGARRPRRSDCAAMAADSAGAAANSAPAPLAGRLRIPVPGT